ncbi:U-box domain-containing protein 57-like [Trifolium pratense]|uniref:U-box domain-containing protein 57-like n=1 Tax=Trifolium pratense TaxID=57577 RepID=UPI001E694D21|nr:U-box domain-containing protein 57-like [Trifolium pratense]
MMKTKQEIKFIPKVMCEPVDENLTFNGNQLENGDILCFQKASAIDTEKHIRHPDVPSYLELTSQDQASALAYRSHQTRRLHLRILPDNKGENASCKSN